MFPHLMLASAWRCRVQYVLELLGSWYVPETVCTWLVSAHLRRVERSGRTS